MKKRLILLVVSVLIMFLSLACDGRSKDMSRIDFKTLNIIENFSNEEGIIVEDEEEKVLVTITKKFSTPGYSMAIDKIVREEDNYKIYYNITPPKSDSMHLQVITYKTIVIEIDKDELWDPPYNFILDGNDDSNKKITR